MLIMPVDRVTTLLERASGIEIQPLGDAAERKAATEADGASSRAS